MANTCTVYLYTDFPINDYSNVYWTGNQNDINTKFQSYCTMTENKDKFEVSNINLTSGVLKLPLTYVISNRFNYMCIQDHSDNFRYYAFIDKIMWNSNLSSCTIKFSIDYFHTYFYRIQFRQSYIVREHVNDDRFGVHILDEGIVPHDYFITAKQSFNNHNYSIALCVTNTLGFLINPDPQPGEQSGQIPNLINLSQYEKTPAILTGTIEQMNNVIERYVSGNLTDSIIGLYLIPSNLVNSTNCADTWIENVAPYPDPICKYFKNNTAPIEFELFSRNKPTTINGYTPKNNKCFCYPFTFARICNGLGQSITAKFELCNDNNTIKFKYHNTAMHNGNGYGYLEDYDGININNDYSLTTMTNPELPYLTNNYSSYMASNRNSLENSIKLINTDSEVKKINAVADTGQSIINSIGGGLKSVTDKNVVGLMGAVTSVANQIFDYNQSVNNIEYNSNRAKSIIDASLKDISMSNIMHGVASINGALMTGVTGFKYQVYAPEYEEIRTIDQYFTRYGYKVNTFKIPNLNCRKTFDYCQLAEVNLIGNIPQEALDVIKGIFSNGVTLWHTLDYMYAFDRDNSIR